MISSTQVALVLALSSLVKGFAPSFSTPRQCSSLSISWSSFALPITSTALSEITMSLIPLDNNPAHFPPEPYTLAVPCSGDHSEGGQVEITKLPFPAGTQFFAAAYIPGVPTRRTVSTVFTVEHSSDSSCLSAATATLDKRAKAFGKRQISVIGVNSIAATAADSTDITVNAPAAATAGNGASVPPISVVGVSSIAASGSDTVIASTTAAAPTGSGSGGAVPAINVLGTTQTAATASATDSVDTPGNVAPAPSANGPIPAIQVIGTSFFTATAAPDASVTASSTDGAFVPNFTTVDVGADQVTTTSCTSTWPETAAATETTTSCTDSATETVLATETTTSCTDAPTEAPTLEVLQSEDASMMTTTMMDDTSSDDSDMGEDNTDEEPCTETLGMDSSFPDVTSSADMASETASAVVVDDSPVVTYGSFDDMVNAANSIVHAWNPYKPAYTPST